MSNWFANARRRLKNTVRGGDAAWDKRAGGGGGGGVPGGKDGGGGGVKGEPEAMDAESDDSAWESGDDSANGKGACVRRHVVKFCSFLS